MAAATSQGAGPFSESVSITTPEDGEFKTTYISGCRNHSYVHISSVGIWFDKGGSLGQSLIYAIQAQENKGGGVQPPEPPWFLHLCIYLLRDLLPSPLSKGYALANSEQFSMRLMFKYI